MNLKTQRAAVLDAANIIVEAAKAAERDLTPEEVADVEAKTAEIKALDEKIAAATKSQATIAALAGTPRDEDEGRDDAPVKGGIGARFVKSAGFQEFRKAHPSGVDGGTPVSIKAAGLGGLAELGFKATLETVTGQPRTDRQPGYQDTLVYDKPSILDLITTGSTTSTSLEYAQITAETDNAAIVAEGQLKPLSDLSTGIADAKVFTYADGFDATNQFLADEPALAAFMDGAVRRHLRSLIEEKILNGAGTAGDPRGILNTSGVQAQAFATDVVTTIAASLEKLAAVNAEPQAIVVNPADAWALRLLKDADGRFLSGGPFGAGLVSTLWGVPIVESRRVAAGTALVGNFRTVNFLEREPLSVLLFNQHKDYAQRNMVYVRAELRGMQLIYSPRELVVATIAGGGA